MVDMAFLKPTYTILLSVASAMVLAVATSCGPPIAEKPETKADSVRTPPQQVTVGILKKTGFPLQIVSTGVLHASHSAELRFRASGEIIAVNVKNGDAVKKGALLAQLENARQKIDVERAREEVDAAEIDLSSLLLGFGGVEGDTASVNSSLLHSLKIQSGHNRARLNLKLANLELENTFLRAPFSGIVAGLQLQPNNFASPSDVFCSLMDNSRFFVVFQLMESEIAKVRLGQTIIAMPMANNSVCITGKVSEINPVVDVNGLIEIKASLVSDPIPAKQLFDGMNMKVVLEEMVADQLVVPKRAVVLRSNKKVVFTFKNGLSKWNYVAISGENTHAYNIGEGLNEGDSVILGGNLNLAHDAEVVVMEENKQP